MAPPRTLVDTRALHPGAIVEVLDAAKLWFPAEVLSVGPAGVRVHFLGWGKAWDDSVSVREYAARLCQYRGWGRTLPGDFRVGEHVEALDLTGVWLPCRVLAVAEALVKVHYLGWPSKWDEWIHRTAGRLQRVKPGTDVRGATEAGKALVARACKAVTRSRVPEVACRHDLDLNEEICSVCEGVGELVCCEGRCLRSFHAECVKPLLAEVGAPPLAPELVVRTRCPRFGAAAPPPPLEPIVERETGAPAEGESRPPSMREGGSSSETADEATPRAGAQRLTRRVEATRRTLDAAGEAGAWVCPDCAHGAQRCALCGEVEREGEALQPPIRCTKPRCCKAFHPSCLASAWEQYGPACAAADRACARGVCPAHVCWECGEPENGRYGNAMTVCCGCGSGFHRSCIPPGSSAFVSSTLGHGLCAECERARGAGGGRARSGARTSGTCAPGARMRPMRGLVPFRFASIPLKDDASGADGDDVDRVAGGGGGWPRGYEVHNVRLLREMRRTSEVGFPWEPLRRRRAPVPFELPAKITAELVEGACDASRGFRPPSFSLICRSIWRAARMDGAKRGEGEPCACSASGLSCGEGCLNRHTLHECTAATCAVGEVACNNRRIQRGVYPALSVFKTLNKGWGVRADCPISHGDIVIEYVGEVIDRDEWERRNATATQHEAIYSMHLSHNLIIDAAHKGNVSRFINHSCAPNLQVQKWFVNSQPRLAMFALRDIREHEELSYDYNVHWTGQWQSGQRCHCGAPNCVGKMSAVAAAAHRKAGGKPKAKRRRQQPSLTAQLLPQLLGEPCKACGAAGDDDCALLCDSCDAAYHIFCLTPRLEAVPSGEWYCPACASSPRAIKAATPAASACMAPPSGSAVTAGRVTCTVASAEDDLDAAFAS